MKIFFMRVMSSALIASLILLISSNTYAQKIHGRTPQDDMPGATYSPGPLLDRYDVHYMKLDLAASDTSVFISGNVTIKATVVQNTDTLEFDFSKNMVVDSVQLNGNTSAFKHSKDVIILALNNSLTTGQTFSAVVFYHGSPTDGLYLTTNRATGISEVSTVSESYLLRNWIPCKQILTDKIDSIDTWITTSKTNQAGANGLLRDVVSVDADHNQFRWHSSYKMAYYLITIVVGNYAVMNSYAHPAALNGDSVLIQNFVYNDANYISDHQNNISKIAPFVELFSNLYGLYPWSKEKYGVALANTGGMENQTLSSCGSFEPTLNAHELSHQWFGDHVTCRTFNDIWLNEGFAVYSEYLAIENRPDLFDGITLSGYVHGWHQRVMSKPDGSVYVPKKKTYNENRIFSGRLTYDKGGSIIHTLRFEIGNDSLFFALLQHYQIAFADSTANVDDFKSIAQQVTGIDFTTFFDQWYYGEGFPTYTIHFSQSGNTLTLKAKQKTSMPSKTPFFNMKMEYLLKSPGGDTLITLQQTNQNQTFYITTNKTITGIVVDPNDWVIDGAATVIEDKEGQPAAVKISVIPNPAHDAVTITAASDFDQVVVMNEEGKTLSIHNFSEANTRQHFTMASLPSGIYVAVLMKDEKKVEEVRVVKE